MNIYTFGEDIVRTSRPEVAGIEALEEARRLRSNRRAAMLRAENARRAKLIGGRKN